MLSEQEQRSLSRGKAHTTLIMSFDDINDDFLDAIATTTEAYPLRMRSVGDYGLLKILHIASSSHSYQTNKTGIRPTETSLVDYAERCPNFSK